MLQNSASVQRDELSRRLDQLLEPARFRDYCSNRLQVESRMEIRSVVTGASASLALLYAVRLGVDACLSGEISEQHVHLARETGVAFVSAGQHATQRFGVHVVGEHLAAQWGLAHPLIEIPNPI